MKKNAPKDLIEKALAVQKKAYAPYSNFCVGSALRTLNNNIFAGCNVENAAYPEGLCAEAGAISAMISFGEIKFSEIVIAGSANSLCTPCGGCRQKIREFTDDKASIFVIDQFGKTLIHLYRQELIPYSFGPGNLK